MKRNAAILAAALGFIGPAMSEEIFKSFADDIGRRPCRDDSAMTSTCTNTTPEPQQAAPESRQVRRARERAESKARR